jgi:hypothetical protein
MAEFSVPAYRVRLFLSVDLTGSTAHKSRASSFEWIKAFQHFYGEFPKLYQKQFESVCADIGGMSDNEKSDTPKIWKTIGDEILFVNRVESVTHLGAYVSAFSNALHFFGEHIGPFGDLNTKGNGWIAAFPSPNRSIGIHTNGRSDPFSGTNDLPSEDLEAAVDQKPQEYDFLGTGIDGGFRIARNSTIDAFTISPALAYLLVKAKTNPDATKFDATFRFHELQSFKGVLGERPYPIISIDTMRSEEQRELRQLETALLNTPNNVDNPEQLRNYLEQFIKLHNVEMPCLKLSHSDAAPTLPDHYLTYVDQWEAEYQKNQGDMASLNEDGDASQDSEMPSADETVAGLKDD